MSASDLTIVVTHHRTPDILRVCLDNLKQFAPGVPVVVVDSDSDDGTLGMLQRDYPQVQALSVINHSMANTVNTGLRHASTTYMLQMNADVYITATTVADLLAVIRHKGVGMVGPRCRNEAGKLQRQGVLYSRYYTVMALTGAKSVPVKWLSGCCQMIRWEVLRQVGGMNTAYRFYNEDIDWCWRINKSGWRCELVKTDVTHLGGSSTPQDPKFIIEGYRGGMRLAQTHKPGWYQWGQRHLVLAEARAKASSSNPRERGAYRAIQAMFAADDYVESPFGTTLTDTNPDFAYFVAPEN